MRRHDMQGAALDPGVGLWGVFGPVRPQLCRILQMEFGERPFHEVGWIRARRRAGRSTGSFITPVLLAYHSSITSIHSGETTQVSGSPVYSSYTPPPATDSRSRSEIAPPSRPAIGVLGSTR
jgi:hypothetical protein